MPYLLHHLTPDLTLLTVTAGICLIFLELNRPGLILPGSLGLLLTLVGAAALFQHQLNSSAIAILTISTLILTMNLYRVLPAWLLCAPPVGLTVGFRLLMRPPAHTPTALACGTLLGVLSAILSRIAFRARQAKAIH